MPENLTATREKLIDDFHKVVTDTEELLRSMAGVGGEKAVALRATVEQQLRTTKERLHQLEGAARERTTAAAKAADEYVHENPWPAIGIAAGVGFVVGVLLSRR
ncbi:MAG TPA: DUF883 family protein [Myxococcota bacterium]|nr:DUF883 family protein [Myxococcota bacterium]